MTALSALRRNLDMLSASVLGTPAGRAHQQRSLRLLEQPDAALAAAARTWPSAFGDHAEAPVFLFAAGWRSGSTFLQRWLMTGSGLLMWGEPFNRSGLYAGLGDQLRALAAPDYPRREYCIDALDGDLSGQWVANLYPPVDALVAAQRCYFDTLFGDPARQRGYDRWGVKEVRLGMAEALYLKRLYPRGRFVFLVRDPVASYASFRGYIGHDYLSWPRTPVRSARQFAAMWRRLAGEFATRHAEVDGLFLRYEDLRAPEIRRRLEDHLGLSLRDPEELARIGGRGGRGAGKGYIPRLERLILARTLGPAARELGYTNPR